MIRSKIIIIVLLGFFGGNSFCQDTADIQESAGKGKTKKKPYISIAKPDIKNISEIQKRLIIRSAIGVIMKSGKYNMLFSSPEKFEDAKFKFHKLVMEGKKVRWGKDKVGFILNFKLVDAYTKEIVREVVKTRIEDRHLVFKAKLLQWELVFGKDKAVAVEKEIEQQTEEELIEEENRSKPVRTKSDRSKGGDAAAVAGLGEKGLPEDGEGASEEEEDEQEKKSELAQKKKKDKKKKKELKISEFNSPDLDLTKQKLDTTIKPPRPFKVDSSVAFGLDFMQETISSSTLIEVENNISLLGIYVDSALQFQENPTDRLHVGFRMTRITSENIYALTPPKSLHLMYKLGFVGMPFSFHAGFEYETQPFAQLGKAGEGIQAWEQSFLWLKGGLSFEFNSLFNRRSGFGGYLFRPFSASSNFATDQGKGEIALSGTKFEVYFLQQVWDKYHLKFSYHESAVTSQGLNGLENSQATTLVSLIYK